MNNNVNTTENKKKKGVEKYRDIIKKSTGKANFMILGIENGMIFAFGGYNGSALSAVECYII